MRVTIRTYEVEEAFGCLWKVPLVMLVIIASATAMLTVVPMGIAAVLSILAAGVAAIALMVSPGIIALMAVAAACVLAAILIVAGAIAALMPPLPAAVLIRVGLAVIRWLGSVTMQCAHIVSAEISAAVFTTHHDLQRLGAMTKSCGW